ncbi:hypothetical protein B7P43_G10986 [Cryptotermes secundus]|uniref:Uncharacterized protein n=1 Tax=Cryptotermes secundus TaxID=105785 RepID=A0A2J7RMJ7_9NEOP|nr:hypothetical protein B7P43_G10986 [Cryptotermes secundus]
MVLFERDLPYHKWGKINLTFNKICMECFNGQPENKKEGKRGERKTKKDVKLKMCTV